MCAKRYKTNEESLKQFFEVVQKQLMVISDELVVFIIHFVSLLNKLLAN
jgi:hypothetical protein